MIENQNRRKKGPIRLAFDLAYRRTEQNKRDKGAQLLGQMYADELDDARLLHAACIAALDACSAEDRKYVASLAKALVARQTLADIGPRYLAVCTALHMTTAARVAGKQPTEATGDESDPAAAALLRLVHGARVRNAAALDAAAEAPDP